MLTMRGNTSVPQNKNYQTTPIKNFAKKYIETDTEADRLYVDGLFEELYAAYEKGMLFRETGATIFSGQ